MQSLANTSTAGTSYTTAQVTGFITASTVVEEWRYERLDVSGRVLSDISSFVDKTQQPPQITHDTTKAVKRSLKIRLRGDITFNTLRDQIRVRYRILAPDGGFLEWVLGTFQVLVPNKKIYPGYTWQDIEAVDNGQLLMDGAFQQSFTAASGLSYVQAINLIAGGYGGPLPLKVLIPDPGKIIPHPLSWEAGETRMTAINDLLEAINYVDLWIDELGRLRSQTIPNYTAVPPYFTFDTTAGASLVKTPYQNKADLSKAFNQFLVLGEDPRNKPISFLYTNSNPASPISTVNWRPKLTTIKDSKIPDLSTAQRRAQVEAQDSALIYKATTVDTFPWAWSQDQDLYALNTNPKDEGSSLTVYREQKWVHNCKAGANTQHEWVQIVPS